MAGGFLFLFPEGHGVGLGVLCRLLLGLLWFGALPLLRVIDHVLCARGARPGGALLDMAPGDASPLHGGPPLPLRLSLGSVSSWTVWVLLLVIGHCLPDGLCPGSFNLGDFFGLGFVRLKQLGHGLFGELVVLGVEPLSYIVLGRLSHLGTPDSWESDRSSHLSLNIANIFASVLAPSGPFWSAQRT